MSAPSMHGGGLAKRGIDVREQINSGFVRSELGTAADDKAKRIYDAIELDPKLLARHAGNAVTNYMAAISCFLRAIPTVVDVRSKKLLQEHVNKLLLRLEGMRALAREAKRLIDLNGDGPIFLSHEERINYVPFDFDPSVLRNEFDDDLADAFDALTLNTEFEWDQSNMFPVDTNVEVQDQDNGKWRPATVSGYDRNRYRVKFGDDVGGDENDVDPARVRLSRRYTTEDAKPARPTSETTLEHELRMEVMSEIIESERQYNLDLHNLSKYYVHVLRNPAHWGGQKAKVDTLFSQVTLNDQEAKSVFANVEEIITMNQALLAAMEHAFAIMETDQSLAALFVKWAPKFKLYTDYVVQYESANMAIEKYRRERMGFRSADEAAKCHSVPPLKVLMLKPINRINTYIDQLRRLQARTPSDHASFDDINRAVELFYNVQQYIKHGLEMKENRKKCRELSERFSPYYQLETPTRFFIFHGKLQRMEGGNSKERIFWLFNDILVCGRVSEWLVRGAFRHINTIILKSYGDNLDFGPLAMFVKGKNGERWNMICGTVEEKTLWMQKMALCPVVINETRRIAVAHQNLIKIEKKKSYRHVSESSVVPFDSVAFQQQAKPPPPPPPRKLPPNWVELKDEGSGKTYFYNASSQKTQWELPTT